ncbi:MAG: zf-HC2 domain-containing protein, partial [Anaerolineae bacterium]|nr:zf-HC2 domain-containing protein [Anaerolineae bacterium]
MSEAHVQEDLLAYLDGELDAAARARVEAHLEQCQLCAAELAQLRELRYGLNVTLDTALSSVRLSREADDRIREVLGDRLARHEHGRAWGGLANWFRALGPVQLRLAQASLALMVLLYSLSTGLALNITAPVQAHEVLVLGESRLAPGSQGALRVIVRDVGGDGEISGDGSRSAVGLSGALTGSPVAGASVMISLLTESGALAPLFAGATDALGTVNASFTVPDLPEGTVELVVETSSSTGVSRLTQQVAIARTYKIFVMSDKPAYRPGQTIALRALVLDAADLRPVTEGRLQWSVRDATGAVVGRAPVDLSSYGVGTWMYELPATVPEGDYQITATFGDTRSERTVRVEAYDLLAFRVALSLARTYAVPGEALGGTVAASYFFDMPVAASIAVVRGTVPELGDQPVVEVAGLT